MMIANHAELTAVTRFVVCVRRTAVSGAKVQKGRRCQDQADEQRPEVGDDARHGGRAQRSRDVYRGVRRMTPMVTARSSTAGR